jgi:hypothetical protein
MFSSKNPCGPKHPTLAILLLLLLLFAFSANAFAGGAAAIPDPMRTIFMIGDIDNTFANYPILVYLINGNQLILADQWSAREEGIGPVGLAVDEVRERLFVSYESHDGVDVYNARNMRFISEIPLANTSDLAGMDVYVNGDRLLVVDRNSPTLFEFDLTTYALLDQWTLPNIEGAVGIDTAGDTLYVTVSTYNSGTGLYDRSNEVHYYDLTTQLELGVITLQRDAVGISVTDFPETTIYTTGHFSHDYLSQYYLSSGIETTVDLDDGGKGVTVDAVGGHVYAVKGYGGPILLTPRAEWGGLQVVSTTSMQVQNTYLSPGLLNKPSPTDAVASTIPFGGTVSKELTSHPSGIIQDGDNVVFEITIENRHTRAIRKLPIKDTYNKLHLTYSHSVPASNDNINDGQIDWSDLTASIGHNLFISGSTTIEVHFTATPAPCSLEVQGVNLAQMIAAKDTTGFTLADAAGLAEYTIECGCTINAECDDSVFCNGAEVCDQTGHCTDGSAPCDDDGQFCNGEESCDEPNAQCQSTAAPCDDDGVFCNGPESCNERDDSCESLDDPCADDGKFCNGEELCNEEDQKCDALNVPECEDDGLFCTGDEVCDEDEQGCVSAGDPCLPDPCEEQTDSCVGTDTDDDDDNRSETGEDEQWPKGEVSGGCCGC